MDPNYFGPVSCNSGGCYEGVANQRVAMALGWREVGNAFFCPCHWPIAHREAKKEAIREQLEVRQRHRNQEVAKKKFTAAEYRAWDEFQSDLANFHKKTGKLAPKILRLMNPADWINEYRQKGRIDVEASAANFEEVKVARGKRTIDVLKGL